MQAGTGTGKSLAYLVPAIARAVATDEPVVVSTATIALQRQLVDRDLPAARRLAGRQAAPQTRVRAAEGSRKLSVPEQDSQRRRRRSPTTVRRRNCSTPVGRDRTRAATCKRLTAWSSDTETGDRDELTPGVPDRSWAQVSVSARECIGASRCPFGTDCFAEKARDKAGHADVVVTNHALLAIDAIADADVLPEHDLLVVDEAHELVDRVTGVATAELSATVARRRAPSRRAARRTRTGTTAGGRDGDVLVGDPRRRRRDASTVSTTRWRPI